MHAMGELHERVSHPLFRGPDRAGKLALYGLSLGEQHLGLDLMGARVSGAPVAASSSALISYEPLSILSGLHSSSATTSAWSCSPATMASPAGLGILLMPGMVRRGCDGNERRADGGNRRPKGIMARAIPFARLWGFAARFTPAEASEWSEREVRARTLPAARSLAVPGGLGGPPSISPRAFRVCQFVVALPFQCEDRLVLLDDGAVVLAQERACCGEVALQLS